MSPEILMILLGLGVLVSYWFNHLARVYRLPSVLMLLTLGLGARALTDWYNVSIAVPTQALQLLGTIGLIMIVLEGGLDLKLSRGRHHFHVQTLLSAGLGLGLCMLLVAAFFYGVLGFDWFAACLAAVPFAVISSAVAIPSAASLHPAQREFVIYESSWSDILGVMLFNALVFASTASSLSVVANVLGGGLALVVFGGALGLGMYWLVGHLQGHVKFLPLIFALILVYGVAKWMHLSPLFIVVMIALILNNPHLLQRFKVLDRAHSAHYPQELEKLKHLTAEATFLVRTFFFLFLGYSTNFSELTSPFAWICATMIVALIVGARMLTLQLCQVSAPVLTWAAPRGLITVLLFYSLPEGVVADVFPQGALVLVIFMSCIVMAVGFRSAGRLHETLPAAQEH